MQTKPRDLSANVVTSISNCSASEFTAANDPFLKKKPPFAVLAANVNGVDRSMPSRR
jgi:hypothetical protein